MSGSVKYLKLLSLAVIPALLLGCMSRTYQHRALSNETPNSPAAAAAVPAVIAGGVTIKTRAGEVRSGADSTVFLIPTTAYATEWFDHYVVNGEKIDGTDPRSFPSARATPVDRDGRFEFRNVPAGAYYLTCSVHYRRPEFRILGINVGYRTLEDVETYANVNIGPGQRVDVLLTRPPA